MNTSTTNERPFEETRTDLELLEDLMYGNEFDGSREQAYEYLKRRLSSKEKIESKE